MKSIFIREIPIDVDRLFRHQQGDRQWESDWSLGWFNPKIEKNSLLFSSLPRLRKRSSFSFLARKFWWRHSLSVNVENRLRKWVIVQQLQVSSPRKASIRCAMANECGQRFSSHPSLHSSAAGSSSFSMIFSKHCSSNSVAWNSSRKSTISGMPTRYCVRLRLGCLSIIAAVLL